MRLSARSEESRPADPAALRSTTPATRSDSARCRQLKLASARSHVRIRQARRNTVSRGELPIAPDVRVAGYGRSTTSPSATRRIRVQYATACPPTSTTERSAVSGPSRNRTRSTSSFESGVAAATTQPNDRDAAISTRSLARDGRTPRSPHAAAPRSSRPRRAPWRLRRATAASRQRAQPGPAVFL